MASGDYIHLATFEQILQELSQDQEVRDRIQRLEIRVIAFSGSESRPTGAYRIFIPTPSPDRIRIRPTTIETLQMSSPQQRRQVRSWIDELQTL